MKPLFKQLLSLGSSLGLLTMTLSIPLPVTAALPCKDGTVNRYQNNSIASCTIENNIQVRIGSLAFPCLQDHSISFDEKGQFQSCVISQSVKIITDNVVETCPAEYRVNVEIYNDGNQSVSCQRY
ncbi:MAG TPA: hypothetical protein V6D09_12275 [Leptolyngbyaceae cyanobacterium]